MKEKPDALLSKEQVEKGSRWGVAAHLSRATGSDLSVTRFGHERYVGFAKTNGLWSDEAASNTDILYPQSVF